jgi:hypothetical protein
VHTSGVVTGRTGADLPRIPHVSGEPGVCRQGMQYIPRNPCRRVQLPNIEKAEDEAMFLTHAENRLIMEGMGERYKAFTDFLVMTGTASGKPPR